MTVFVHLIFDYFVKSKKRISQVHKYNSSLSFEGRMHFPKYIERIIFKITFVFFLQRFICNVFFPLFLYFSYMVKIKRNRTKLIWFCGGISINYHVWFSLRFEEMKNIAEFSHQLFLYRWTSKFTNNCWNWIKRDSIWMFK